MNNQNTLITKEIYLSVQGEARFSGQPCIFVRLSGCPLRCKWCDTAYAFEGGEPLSLKELRRAIEEYLPYKCVELTGGEPLAQQGTVELIDELCKDGYQVMIETSGSHDVSTLSKDCHIIMDLKCPDSKMEKHNLYENINHLKKTDEVKFVVASDADFEWACKIAKEHDLFSKCQVLLSPAWGLMKPEKLTSLLLESQNPFKLNLQIHKYIWNPRAKGV